MILWVSSKVTHHAWYVITPHQSSCLSQKALLAWSKGISRFEGSGYYAVPYYYLPCFRRSPSPWSTAHSYWHLWGQKSVLLEKREQTTKGPPSFIHLSFLLYHHSSREKRLDFIASCSCLILYAIVPTSCRHLLIDWIAVTCLLVSQSENFSRHLECRRALLT